MPASVTRQFQFAHYKIYDILSRDPSEQTWIPKAPFSPGSPATIQRRDVELVRDAFVYLFVDSAGFKQANPFLGGLATGEAFFIGACQVDRQGNYAFATFLEITTAAGAARSPNFDPFNNKTIKLPAEVQGADIPMFAIVSRTLLPLPTIQKWESKRPPQVPLVKPFDDTHFAVIVDGQQSSAQAEWVMFVVDPIKIAESFTKVYYRRADDYLALTQPYAQLSHEKRGKQRQADAKVRALQKAVADTVNGMISKSAGTSLGNKIQAAADLPAIKQFLSDFDADVATAVKAREAAALDLIHWIRSQLWLDVDESFRQGSSTGALGDDYVKFLAPLSHAFARLTESDPGVAYMMELLLELDVSNTPDLTIPNVFTLQEFFLRGDGAVADAVKVTNTVVGTTSAFVSAWGAFVGLVHAINMERLRSGSPEGSFGSIRSLASIPSPLDSSLLGRSTFRMASVLNKAYQVKVVDILTPQLFVDFAEVDANGARTVTQVFVLDVHYGLVGNDGSAFLQVAGKVTHAALTKVLSILNVGLAAYSLQQGFAANAKFDRDNAFKVIDFTQAILDSASTGEAFVGFWQRLNGKVDIFGQPLLTSKVLAGYFGLFSSVLSLASSTNRAITDYQTKDFDAFAGDVASGIGAALTGVGSFLIIKGGATGPYAGWFIFGGAVLSLGGYIATAFADDSDVEILVKFCAFGQFAGDQAPAPPWALTPSNDFKDWTFNTELGLTRQLEAFQNIFFAFVVDVAPGTADTLRIFPSALRAGGTFEIDFTAVYNSPLSNTVPPTDPRTLGHQRTTKVTVDPDKLTLSIKAGVPIVTQGVVKRQLVNGLDVIDIRVVPDATGSDGDLVIANPNLKRLNSQVLLDVHGDSSLFIPSDKAGNPRIVPILVFDSTNFPASSSDGPKSSTTFHA